MLYTANFSGHQESFWPTVFASRLTFQIPRFFSWRPDPLAEAVDAFQGLAKHNAIVPDRQGTEPSTMARSSAGTGNTGVEG